MERFASDHELSFKRARQGIRADIAEISLDGRRALLSIPSTFMNESGQAVAPLVRYFGIQLESLLIVHDDIDVPFGKLKVQWAGGHGGNNGVRSIVGSLKTGDFWRLKLGVGRPPGRIDPADYVLARFGSRERADIDVTIARALDVVARFIGSDGEEARQCAGELND